MRAALLSKSKLRLQVSKSVSLPAPIGGLNFRDPYTGMKETDAVDGYNFYPRGNYVELRAGSSSHATGMTGNGKTLAVHSAMNGTETMYCATASNIYDVSSPGVVGAAKLARTSGKHQWVNYGDGTNNWLIMVNGVDKPAYYNGTAWTAVDAVSVPALTGVTTTKLVSVTVYMGRLFFIEVDTLKTWYLASGVVGGALTAFDLSTQASRGGYLMAAMGWTFDGGLGPDDHIVFITSMGEAIVYRGTDPATAADWQKVGTFYVGRPIGRQCLCKYGGDVLVMTEDGITAMSGVLTGLANDSKYKITDKIKNKYLLYSSNWPTTYGWQMVVYPKENALIVNVSSSEDVNSTQFVMNMQTGAWTEFFSWYAMSFCVFNRALYSVLGTVVSKNWSGVSDSGSAIVCNLYGAYSQLGIPKHKKIKAMRVSCSGNTSAESLALGIATVMADGYLQDGSTTQTLVANANSRDWVVPPSFGGEWIKPAISISSSTAGGLLKFYSVEYVYEDGNISS